MLGLLFLKKISTDSILDGVLAHLLADQILITANATWGQAPRKLGHAVGQAWDAVHLVLLVKEAALVSHLACHASWTQHNHVVVT